MTRIMKALLSVAIVAVIAVSIAGIYAALSNTQEEGMTSKLYSIYARKEDLLTEQERLETFIKTLNKDINLESARQQELEQELNNLTLYYQSMTNTEGNTTITSTTKTTTMPTVITTTTQPRVIRVTRAS